jgi:hypothetical protein
MTARSQYDGPDHSTAIISAIIVAVAVLLVALVVLGMWGCPKYRVYNQEQHGKAELARAQFNRQIAVLEATAKEESAKRFALADSIRATGVAAANKIIGHSLRENEEYLTWLWIEALKEGGNDVIYVPTEANLPILEAGRLRLTHPAPPGGK